MFAWNVDPWALNVPVAHAGAEPAGAAGDEAPAGVEAEVLAADAEGVLDVGLAVLFLLVPHAAAANKAPAVSRVAAMREVLTR
jgi:hypothetical protein